MIAGSLPCATKEFLRLRQLCESALAQLNDDQWFVEPYPDGNSIALIVKHLSGNMHSRWTDFLTTDGEKPDRDRDSEFVVSPSDTRAGLQARWESGWECLFQAIGPLGEADLDRVVRIRGEEHTVLEAIHRQLTHYAYHIGQIVFCARQLAGANWKTLSIAKKR